MFKIVENWKTLDLGVKRIISVQLPDSSSPQEGASEPISSLCALLNPRRQPIFSQNLDFFCESISIFFSLSSFFPFFSLLIAIFIAHFIVFLSHEILAGFFSNKGRDL